MSFDEIVHESVVEYEEKAEEKKLQGLPDDLQPNPAPQVIIKCWCGGNTARSTVGDMKRVCLESVWHDPSADGQPTTIRTLYVAGPMTGYTENNYPAFNLASHQLRSVGFEIVNPAEFGANQPASYVELLKRDLHALMECDGVATLENWWESVGARNEVQVAGLLKMPVRSLGEWLQIKTGR